MEWWLSIHRTLGCRIKSTGGNVDQIHTTVCVHLLRVSVWEEGRGGAVARNLQFKDVIFVYLSFGKIGIHSYAGGNESSQGCEVAGALGKKPRVLE